MNQYSNFLLKRLYSFGYAFRGIAYFICTQPNAWIHLIAMVVVICLGFYQKLNLTEWVLIVLAVGLVLSAEAFNTAVEKLTDLVSPEYHPIAGIVKDIAAGAVLITAIAAAVIGVLIFTY
jgi:diacylglycerol kinase (ATP)